MKICTKCNKNLFLEMFSKKKTGVLGYTSMCKICLSITKKTNYAINKNNILSKNKKYYEANKNKILKLAKERYEKTKDLSKCRERNKSQYEKNKDKFAARTGMRRAIKLKSTPKWVDSEEKWLIQEAYNLAELRSKIFNFKCDIQYFFYSFFYFVIFFLSRTYAIHN
jgi:hypothetical protein